jgi:hypothetical protein
MVLVFLTNLIELNHKGIDFAYPNLIKFVHIIPITVNNMRSKIKELQSEITKIEKGDGDISACNQAIYLTNHILEKLYIIRYKAYIEARKPSETEPVAFDILSPETSVQGNIPTEPFAEPSISDPGFNEPPHAQLDEEERIPEPLQESEEGVVIEPEKNEPVESPVSEDIEGGGPDHSGLLELIAQSRGKHEKIDSFNGHYSLREKIDYINELFGQSSEAFTNAVRLIDHHSNVASMLPHLGTYYAEYQWEKAKKEVLLGFLEKLVACYEDH